VPIPKGHRNRRIAVNEYFVDDLQWHVIWTGRMLCYNISSIGGECEGNDMRAGMGKVALAALLAVGITAAQAGQPAISVVAAENFYGDMARQIAGPDVPVTSILSNPDDDPHMFEASASVARALAGARIVIANGADYDPWIDKLLAASPSANRQVITVAVLIHRTAGDNPHLWYDPAAMPAAAEALATALGVADPAHAAGYAARRDVFLASLQPIQAKVRAMREKYAGTKVTATEPVFGYMAAALGLTMRNERFQIAVMNDTEPSASDVAAFEDDLRQHKVRLFLYNSQASDAAAKRLLDIAQAAKIPVVGVTETEPAGSTFQSWVLGELQAVDAALSRPGS
jgi:zinc/manganese transport system substrate-binding protein